ncbi:MAG: adenosine kinase [Magnetococcales bacterium]|nr:adenosine kinase [Magnetococcales bacterium]
MSHYDVYSIGHALVDLECEVSDSFLQQAGLQKGSMQLVDQTRQIELLHQLQQHHHVMKRSCGGSAANSAIAVAQLGGTAFHACKVADDDNGRFYAADMEANGVANDLLTTLADGLTGCCLVLITPDAERTMCTFLGVSETLSPDHIAVERLSAARYLYVEGYLVSSQSALDAALKAVALARQQGIKVAFTFSDVNMLRYCRNQIDAVIGGGVDLLFCNQAEACHYAATDHIADASLRLREVSAAVCITLGGRGATLYDGTRQIEVVSPMVQAINTNGAGDLFAGAFLYGVNHGHDFAGSGRLACQAASRLVTQFGARLTIEQTRQIKRHVLEGY